MLIAVVLMTINDHRSLSPSTHSSADDHIANSISQLTDQIQSLRLDLEATKKELQLTRSELKKAKEQQPILDNNTKASDVFEIGDIVKINNHYRSLQYGITGTVTSVGNYRVSLVSSERTGKPTTYSRKFTNLILIRKQDS